jgi:hypothetical protein
VQEKVANSIFNNGVTLFGNSLETEVIKSIFWVFHHSTKKLQKAFSTGGPNAGASKLTVLEF